MNFVCCWRAPSFRQARNRALSLLSGSLQWHRVFERAERYRIFPLLYAGLRTLGFPGVPEHVCWEWTRNFRFNAIQNELLARELARVLRILGDAGIPVMPLKGVALGESLYGGPVNSSGFLPAVGRRDNNRCCDRPARREPRDLPRAAHLPGAAGRHNNRAGTVLLDYHPVQSQVAMVETMAPCRFPVNGRPTN